MTKTTKKLPAGFEVIERDEVRDVTILQYKKQGFVTIDFKRRGFGLGFGFGEVRRIPDMKYKGVGWRERMTKDAQDELAQIYDTPSKVKK